MERWFSRYPITHQNQLLSRLKARDPDSHNSAFFELLLHEYLLASGFDVLEIEPAVLGTGKTPDFLVADSDGKKMYIEATVVSGHTKQEKARAKRVQTVIEALQSLKSNKFHLRLGYSGFPDSISSLKKLKRGAQDWISDCTGTADPPHSSDFNGMKLELSVFATKKSGGPTLGLIVPEGRTVSPHLDLRSSISKKSNKYKKVDIPIVLALNFMEMGADSIDVFSAIFGTDIVRIRENSSGKESATLGRKSDGAFFSDGPINTRITGLLVFDGVGCWNIETDRNTIYYANPYAKYPLPNGAFGVSFYKPNETTSEMEFVEETPLQSILNRH